MGFQTLVYGYIQTFPNRDEDNRNILNSFSFDSVYPFPNIYAGPLSGYQWSIVSFAGSFKDLYSEIEHWQSRFEQLLRSLHAFSAQVHITTEQGARDSIEYVRILRSDNLDQAENRNWLITRTTNISGDTQEEERAL